MRSFTLRASSCSAAAVVALLTGCTDSGRDHALNPAFAAPASELAYSTASTPPEGARLALGDSAAGDLQQAAPPTASRRDADALWMHGSD